MEQQAFLQRGQRQHIRYLRPPGLDPLDLLLGELNQREVRGREPACPLGNLDQLAECRAPFLCQHGDFRFRPELPRPGPGGVHARAARVVTGDHGDRQTVREWHVRVHPTGQELHFRRSGPIPDGTVGGGQASEVVEADLGSREVGEHARGILVEVAQDTVAEAATGHRPQGFLDLLERGQGVARIACCQPYRVDTGEPAHGASQIGFTAGETIAAVAFDVDQHGHVRGAPGTPPPPVDRDGERGQQDVGNRAAHRGGGRSQQRRGLSFRQLHGHGSRGSGHVAAAIERAAGQQPVAGANGAGHLGQPVFLLGRPFPQRQGPVPDRRAQRLQLHRVARRQVAPCFGQVSQQDPPGNPVHDEMVHGEQ